MATKTSRRALTADAVLAAEITGTTTADQINAPAGTTDIDAANTPCANTPDTGAATTTATATEPVPTPRTTKAAQLRAMLDAPGGASLASLMAATGWQAHTVRAALSGLRKGGADLARETRDGNTVYYIVNAGAERGSTGPETAGSQPTTPGSVTSETGVPA